MQFLEDIMGSELLTTIKKKGTEMFEAADAVVAEKYAVAKPKIDEFIDTKVAPAVVKIDAAIGRAATAAEAVLVKYL